MNGPPKKGKRPALASKPGVRLTSTYYGTVALLANVFGSAFWFLKQRRSRPAAWIDTERSEQ